MGEPLQQVQSGVVKDAAVAMGKRPLKQTKEREDQEPECVDPIRAAREGRLAPRADQGPGTTLMRTLETSFPAAAETRLRSVSLK